MTFSGMTRPVRSQRIVRPVGVAPARQVIDLGLVEVLHRIEAAVHVAVERGVADRHLRLVAGGHHHGAELVGDGHQDGAAGPRLEVLLGDVRLAAGEDRLERLSEALDRLLDRHDVVAHAQRLGDLGGVGEAFLGGVAIGQHDAMDPARAQRVHRHRRGDGRIDAAGKAEHDAGEAGLVDVVAEPHDAGLPIGLLEVRQGRLRPVDASAIRPRPSSRW